MEAYLLLLLVRPVYGTFSPPDGLTGVSNYESEVELWVFLPFCISYNLESSVNCPVLVAQVKKKSMIHL